MSDIQVHFPRNLYVGTSSWSCEDWCGQFYPRAIAPAEMIAWYSERLRTVEIDSTWYRMPTRNMVDAWKNRTPQDFIFSAKVPKIITHEKYLENCEQELHEFLSVMTRLGKKLGPMVLQFPYMAKGKDPEEYKTGADFLARLRKFAPLLSRDFKWGIEIRNSGWIQSDLLEILQSREISLVFIDYYTMDPWHKLSNRQEAITAPFVYIRFLGNRKQMEATVKQARHNGIRSRDWEGLIVDRTEQMKRWLPAIREAVTRNIPVYVYFNNHYAGYAPGSLELFSRLYNSIGDAP